MILAWANLADGAALTVGSEQSTLPGANVKIAHLSRKWFTASGVKSSYLLWDMGASVACALLAALGSNLTSAATLRLRASDADPSAAAGDKLDTGAIAAGVKTGYGAAYYNFASVTARYWRMDLADATVPDTLQVGRVFLGPCWQTSQALVYDWGVMEQDASRVIESRGGQSFADVLPQRRVLSFTIDSVTEAEIYTNPFAMARAQGMTGDVLCIPQEASAYKSEQSVWGLVTAYQPLKHRRARQFTQSFTIKERL